MNDYLGNEIKIGNRVVVQHGSTLSMGVVTHFSAAGSAMVQCKWTTVDSQYHHYVKRILSFDSEYKVLILDNIQHIFDYLDDDKLKIKK